MEIRVISDDSVYLLQRDLLGEGETAHVFPAHLEGRDPDQANWAVKLAKNQQHNVYVEREYDTLAKLHDAASASPGAATPTNGAPPFPSAKLGTTADGRKALIMQPVLGQSLLETFEGLANPLEREKLALRGARQYAGLLHLLVRANLSCLDRKLGDLWWVGPPETGYLVVTDWNVVSEMPNQIMDLRRFGLLWFELIIGRQMPRDFQPRRRDFDQIQEKVSYGLWYVIGRAVGSSMGPQFHPLQELAEVLDDLIGFYQLPSQSLAQQARRNLKQAQSYLDRTKADLAWIQFDMARRLGARELSGDLEQARLWAYDPVAQAAPDLLRILSSPHFSEAKEQLQGLRQKAQRPQELGDIERLQFGFDVLNSAKDFLIKARDTAGLTQVAQEFAEVQDVLVEGIIQPLMAKDGSLAQKHVRGLTYLLPAGLSPDNLDKLSSLAYEALFWVEYQKIQRRLYARPDLAIKGLENIRAIRNLIHHWPPLYEPTVGDLDRLQAVIESNLRSAVLAGETRPATNTPTEANDRAAPAASGPRAGTFWPALQEDLVKSGWGHGIPELLTRLELEPEDEEAKAALREVWRRLARRHQELTQATPRPGRLAEHASVLQTLLQLPVGAAPEQLTTKQLQQALTEVQDLEVQIARDQQALFQNPGLVLARAMSNGYELFDDPGLSVAVLKAVDAAGRWDNDKFSQETVELEERAARLLQMTNLLEEREQVLKQVLALYTPWLEEPSPIETSSFLNNTLQLYLATAQAELQAGKDAVKSLARAKHLLDYGAQFLKPVELSIYQDLYDQLIEIGAGELDIKVESLSDTVIEAQLEGWFQAYRFEDCYRRLGELSDDAQRQTWATRLSDAGQLRSVVSRGEPELDNKYFRKKQNVQTCRQALEALRRYAGQAEPMAYALYKDEIERLYQRTWHLLQQLDKKSAQRFEPTIRSAD